MNRLNAVTVCVLLAGAGTVVAAEDGTSPDRLAAEGWLGGAGQLLEISQWVRDGLAADDPGPALDALAALARQALEAGQREVCVEAEIGWLQLAMADAEADAGDALDELARRAREWGLPREEARIWSWRATLFEGAGEWLAAFHAHDRASQAALGGGLLNRGAASLVAMARLCRENRHPWRLQHQWVRIDTMLAGRIRELDVETRRLLADERLAAQPVLAGLPPLGRGPTGAVLNPPEASALVARPQQEIGRTRIFLSNPTAKELGGSLTATPRVGRAGSWVADESGQTLTVRPPGEGGAEGATRALSLRPGETLSLYVEHLPSAADDMVTLAWQADGGKGVAATSDFFFTDAAAAAAVVSGGNLTTVPGWPVPFYHEINQRTGGVRIEDLGFKASGPCRLEIFDGDERSLAGFPSTRLLAVDGDGDGLFTGPRDEVLSDHNGDGVPDVLVGDRSRSLEVYAWPLGATGREPLTISARLRRPGGGQEGWRTDVEVGLRPAEKVVGRKER